MGLNVRSVLCLFLAVLGLWSFDAAEARRRGGGHRRLKKCGRWQLPVRVGYWWVKCVTCGGHPHHKKTLACKGPHKCRHGYEHQGRFCVRKHEKCGGEHETCCKRHHRKFCRDGLECKGNTCVKPSCDAHGDECCRGRRCNGKHLKCIGYGRGRCVAKPQCGYKDQRCCRPWWGRCKHGLKCRRGHCVGGGGGMCTSNHECKSPPGPAKCYSGTCKAGSCTYEVNEHATCDGEGDCTGTCNGDGNCVCPDPCGGVECGTCQTCSGGHCVDVNADDTATCTGEGGCAGTCNADGNCVCSDGGPEECQPPAAGECSENNLCCAGKVCNISGNCVALDCPEGTGCAQCNGDGRGVCADVEDSIGTATCGQVTCNAICNAVCGTTGDNYTANQCSNSGGGNCQGVSSALDPTVDFMGGPCCKCKADTCGNPVGM